MYLLDDWHGLLILERSGEEIAVWRGRGYDKEDKGLGKGRGGVCEEGAVVNRIPLCGDGGRVKRRDAI